MTSSRSEFSRIARIARILSSGDVRASGVELGIGDDAAVLRAKGRLVWTIDAQVEGVHFRREWVDWEGVGYRSFQAAVSDLAAMGAEPLGAVANLSLPRRFADRDLEALVRGQARAARECGCPLVGGNLSRSDELSITTSALGTARAPILRSGARPKHELWLVGDVGMAAFGLAALSGRFSRSRSRAAVDACLERWRHPRALLREGLALVGRARAAIDVSDGLAGDAAHIAHASGVRVVIDETRLRGALTNELERAAAAFGVDPLEFALNGGEDYALLAAGPSARRPAVARVIGSIEGGRGVVLRGARGKRRPLGKGHDHFA